MTDVAWGEPKGGVSFGLASPGTVEIGGKVPLELYCQNSSSQPIFVYGFRPNYSRTLRVSPPKVDRPYIRVSFADREQPHPADAFTYLLPGSMISAPLDLSFVFKDRGVGKWKLAFAYDPVQAEGAQPWVSPDGEVRSGLIELVVNPPGAASSEPPRVPTNQPALRAESVRPGPPPPPPPPAPPQAAPPPASAPPPPQPPPAAPASAPPQAAPAPASAPPVPPTQALPPVSALGAEAQQNLDQWLLSGAPDTVRAIQQHGEAGVDHVVSRLAKMAALGQDATLGWSAFHVLPLLGESALHSIERLRSNDPAFTAALGLARDWVRLRCGFGSPPEKHTFAQRLDGLVAQPDLRGEFILTWTASEMPRRRMQVYGNGYRLVTVATTNGPPVEQRSNLDPQQMGILMESIRHGAVWILRPVRSEGAPDERRPALHVRIGPGAELEHVVQLWHGEWRAGPSYYLADLLDHLLSEGSPPS